MTQVKRYRSGMSLMAKGLFGREDGKGRGWKISLFPLFGRKEKWEERNSNL